MIAKSRQSWEQVRLVVQDFMNRDLIVLWALEMWFYYYYCHFYYHYYTFTVIIVKICLVSDPGKFYGSIFFFLISFFIRLYHSVYG